MRDFSLMCRTFTFNRLSPGTDFLISIVATKGLKRSQPTVLMVSTCKSILYLINFSWVKRKEGKLLCLKSITSCVCAQAQLCLTLRLHGLQPTRLLSMAFFRQEYWSGLPFPSPEGLPNPGIKPMALASSILADRFFTTGATWETPISS